MIEDGPFLNAFETKRENVLKQKLITLFVRDGVLVEETVERVYCSDGDYTDNSTSEPLISAKELLE
jgi:hypothetical protein